MGRLNRAFSAGVSLLFIDPGAFPQADDECRAFGAKHIREMPSYFLTEERFHTRKEPPVHRCSHFPLGEFVLKDQEAFLTYFPFTSSLRTSRLRPSILDTRVLEPHSQSVRSSGTHHEASRARFPSSGCFPRHAVGRRGDELAMPSPRRKLKQLSGTTRLRRGYGGQATTAQLFATSPQRGRFAAVSIDAIYENLPGQPESRPPRQLVPR